MNQTHMLRAGLDPQKLAQLDVESGSGSHGANFLGSMLYSYKLNWQTVLFVGYGDDRVILPDKTLARTGRSLFFKVSYAYQR